MTDQREIFDSPVGQARSVVGEHLDGELVLFDPVSGQVHVLNATAALIWDALDGKTPTERIVDELADAFDVDGDVIDGHVRSFLDTFHDLGLLSNSTPALPIPEPETICQAKLTATGWSGTDAFQVGNHLVGVRSGSDEVRELVCAALAPHRRDEVAAPPNLSLRLEPVPAGEVVRKLHILYRGCTPAVRARSARRAVLGLMQHLDLIDVDTRRDSAWHDSVVVVRGSDAVLVARRLARNLAVLEPLLRGVGLQVVDVPAVELRSGATTVRVNQPSLDTDPEAFDALASYGASFGDEELVDPQGELAVRGFLVGARGDGLDETWLEGDLATACVVDGLANRDALDGHLARESVRAIVTNAPVLALWKPDRHMLVARISEMFGHELR